MYAAFVCVCVCVLNQLTTSMRIHNLSVCVRACVCVCAELIAFEYAPELRAGAYDTKTNCLEMSVLKRL